MNAQGIAVFYGATHATVTLAEVRPPVGSEVVVARFDICRPLRLLDLTALGDVHDDGSIFDPTLKRRLERAAFLRSLGTRMAQPVMPDDEAFEYLPTQAVADFLGAMNEPHPLLLGLLAPALGRAGGGVAVWAVANMRNGEPVSWPTALKIPPQVPLTGDGGAVGGDHGGLYRLIGRRPQRNEGPSHRGRRDSSAGATAAASGPPTFTRVGASATDVPPSAATGAAVEPARACSGAQG